MLTKKNKIFIFYYIYIKLELYLNFFIFNNNLINNKNHKLNYNFCKRRILNKIYLNFNLKKRCLIVYFFNLSEIINFLNEINHFNLIKVIYYKKIKNTNLIQFFDRFLCVKFFYKFFYSIFIFFYKFLSFLNFLKINE